MTIELIKDVLKIEELRGKEETQTLVETETYLSPSKPNIEKLLWTDGQVEVLSTKVIRDRLVVSGVVKFKVVYKSTEEELNVVLTEVKGLNGLCFLEVLVALSSRADLGRPKESAIENRINFMKYHGVIK